MAWKLYEGDCFDYFHLFEDKSIDMILCDLPYGTTQNKWDFVIDLKRLWKEYKRIIKERGAIVLTAQPPFDKVLACSNLDMFKQEWIWEKPQGTNFLNANKMPLKNYENILVFYKNQCVYNPQLTKGRAYHTKSKAGLNKGNYGAHYDNETINNGFRYPKAIIKFNQERGLHPTQKPVKLFEYLIQTYTNEGDLVLDNCAGSGTTGVACEITNRNSILIEKEPEYCEIIRERLSDINMEEYQPQRVHKPLTAF